MKSSPFRAPMLRLVNAESRSHATAMRPHHAGTHPHTHAVARPAHRPGVTPKPPTPAEDAPHMRAPALSALDPRWVFAVLATKALEGGRAAILRPEARQRLLREAARMGLRPFDANLVIAVVQDGARSGEGALGLDSEARLLFVRPPKKAAWLTEFVSTGALVTLVLGAVMIGAALLLK